MTYDIYFGTTNNPTTLVSPNLTIKSYNSSALNQGVIYYWKVVAKDNHSNSSTSPIWNFTTQSNNGSGIVFNPNLTYGSINGIDGNTYKTITIGTQTWMAENLKTTKFNDGTSISSVTESTAWSSLTTPGYCWYNKDESTYRNIYGALYNWYSVNLSSNGNKNVCPTGWHVPQDIEWTTLENYLIVNSYNYDGTTSGDKYGKALASSNGWKSSTNIGAVGNTDFSAKINATGFTALPSGSRARDGIFAYIEIYGYWWSSNESDQINAWARGLYNSNSVVLRNYNDKRDGFSVRCLKDN